MSEETAGILTEEILSHIGTQGPEDTASVNLTELVRYANAVTITPEPNPLFTDEEAAAASPFGGTIAPFQFYSVPFTPMPLPSSVKEDGIPGGASLMAVELPPLPLPRTMAGGLDVTYIRPVRPGDILSRQTTLAAMTEKTGKSGPLVFTTMETTYRDAAGEPVVIVRQSIISR